MARFKTRFRIRVEYVDAVQWFKAGDHPAVLVNPNHPYQAWINTSRGAQTVEPGDWIITDAHDGLFVCSPYIFILAFILAEEEGASSRQSGARP